MDRLVHLCPAAAAAVLLSGCFRSDNEPTRAGPHAPYGCRSLDDLKAIEGQVTAFRERRDEDSITYYEVREMIVESPAVQMEYFGCQGPVRGSALIAS